MKIPLFYSGKRKKNQKKLIYIHLGPDKTGTSAIQLWCINNRGRLLQQGINYPDHSVDKNGISSGHNGLFFNKGKRFTGEKLLPLIEQFRCSTNRMLILSSENLWKHLPEIQYLVPDATFIFYLRLGADYQMSSYHQTVKRHGKVTPFRLNEHQHRVFQLKLDDIDLDRIHFRYYHPALFQNNCVENDFLSFLNIKYRPVKNTRINTSLHYDALEFKRFMNHFHLSTPIDKRLDLLLQTYQPDNQVYSLMTEKTYQTNNAKTQVDFLALANKYAFNIENTDLYFTLLKNKPLGQFRQQQLTYGTFLDCMNYIESKDAGLKSQLMHCISEPDEIVGLPRTYCHLKPYLSNLPFLPFNNLYKIPSYRKLSTLLINFYGDDSMERKLAIDLANCQEEAIFRLDKLPIALTNILSMPYTNKLINPDALRDLGLIIEAVSTVMAFNLMNHAAKLRPQGSFILAQRQLYEDLLSSGVACK